MDLNIKKDKRAKGLFFHKAPRGSITKAKSYALKDISKESGKNKLYRRVYVYSEGALLKYLEFLNSNTEII